VQNMQEDARLDPDFIVVPSQSSPAMSGDVLLTGASGFLGAYVLKELLQDTATRVHCLVRARDAENAFARVKANLSAYRCWDESFAARIHAVPGDLSQEKLGLARTAWERLSKVDAVYHVGAAVNSLHHYAKLRAANVGGTKQLLRL